MPIETQGVVYIWISIPLLFIIPVFMVRAFYRKEKDNKNKMEVSSGIIIIPLYWIIFIRLGEYMKGEIPAFIALWSPFIISAVICFILLLFLKPIIRKVL